MTGTADANLAFAKTKKPRYKRYKRELMNLILRIIEFIDLTVFLKIP